MTQTYFRLKKWISLIYDPVYLYPILTKSLFVFPILKSCLYESRFYEGANLNIIGSYRGDILSDMGSYGS